MTELARRLHSTADELLLGASRQEYGMTPGRKQLLARDLREVVTEFSRLERATAELTAEVERLRPLAQTEHQQMVLKLREKAQAFCDSFADHADRCRPCTVAWQNLREALK